MNTFDMSQFALPKPIQKLMGIFRDGGFEVFVVGGPVRNMLLHKPINNWDFATNAKPDDILKLFENAKYENDFGTVIVPFYDEHTDQTLLCEITPFRHEGSYSDQRHPESISWADTIEEDVIRRDFTINAMAFDGSQLIDITNGQADLQAKLIRAVGDPDKRFSEDALRLMRAVRFAVELGFEIEPATYAAIQKHASLIQKISWERIRDEFMKILSSDRPAEGILLLRDTGLLSHIMPELAACFGVEQKSPERHHTYDVGTHLVESLRHCPAPDAITRFAALIHDIGKPETRAVDERGITTFYNHEIVGATIAYAIAERLRLSKKDKSKLVKLVRYHMFSVSEDQNDKTLRRLIRKVGLEDIESLLAIRTGDRVGSGVPETSWRTELFKRRLEEVQHLPFTVHDLNIEGTDVMDILGLKPGPEVGKVLNQLFEMVDSGTLKNEEEELLAQVREMKSSK